MPKVSIRKRNNYFQYRIVIRQRDGTRKEISSGGFINEEEALIAGYKRLDEINAMNGDEPKKIKFGAFIDVWLEDRVRRNELRESTIKKYKTIIDKHIKPSLGQLLLSNIRCKDIYDFQTKKYKEGCYTNEYINCMTKVIKISLNDAVCIYDYIKVNPVLSLKGLPIEEKEIKIIDDDTFKVMMEYFKEDLTMCMVLIMLRATGARPSEIMGLTWDDIDFTNNIIYINKQSLRISQKQYNGLCIGPPKTKKGVRIIPVDPWVMKVLEYYKYGQEQYKNIIKNNYIEYSGEYLYNVNQSRWLMVVNEGNKGSYKVDYVFVNANGSYVSYDTVKSRFGAFKKAMNVDYVLYDNRKTYATTLKNSGVEDKTLINVFGHSNINITNKHYIKQEIYIPELKEFEEANKRLLPNTIKESIVLPTR